MESRIYDLLMITPLSNNHRGAPVIPSIRVLFCQMTDCRYKTDKKYRLRLCRVTNSLPKCLTLDYIRFGMRVAYKGL